MTQSWIFDHQAYFVKASIFTEEIIKGRDWFQESVPERTFKNLWPWKSTFAKDEGGNSSKKGQKQMERGDWW